MTILYLDTEFNGFKGQLISMALISPQGNEWYEVCELPRPIEPWVQQHVVPVLGKEPLRPLIFKSLFQQWIIQFKEPWIVCDWHTDAQHFCEMLSGVKHGTSLDFAFNIKCIKTPEGKPVSLIPHNALADAKALMEWHRCETHDQIARTMDAAV